MGRGIGRETKCVREGNWEREGRIGRGTQGKRNESEGIVRLRKQASKQGRKEEGEGNPNIHTQPKPHYKILAFI